MPIDEHLPPQARKELKEVELAKLARRDGQPGSSKCFQDILTLQK
jgi:hypothetical protein